MVDLTADNPADMEVMAAKEFFEQAVATAVKWQQEVASTVAQTQLEEQQQLYQEKQVHMDEMQWQLVALHKMQHSADGNGDDDSAPSEAG